MPRSLIIVLIIGICHFGSTLSIIRTKTINHTIPLKPGQYFYHDHRHLTSASRVYGVCLQNPYDNEYPCRFFLQTSHPIELPNHLISCDFNVTSDMVPDRYLYFVDDGLVTLAKDKAVLYLGFQDQNQGLFRKFYMLDFSNCTALLVKYKNDTSIKSDDSEVLVQSSHGDLVYIVFLNKSKRQMRILTMDLEGKIVADVPEWVSFSRHMVFCRFLYSPIVGRLNVQFDVENEYEVSEKWTVKTFAIDNKGLSYKREAYTVTNASNVLLASSEGYLTSCFGRNKMGYSFMTMTCVQIDSNGETKFIINLQSTQVDNYYFDDIRNIPGGGFILFTVNCVGSNKDCNINNREYSVTKIDSSGKIVGSLQLPNFDSHIKVNVYLFKDDNGSMCYSMLCKIADNSNVNVSLKVICSNDEDYVYDESTPLVVIEKTID